MAPAPDALSPTAARVLEMIAQGHTYEQILLRHPELTYFDIFAAADEALALARAAPPRTAPPPAGVGSPVPDRRTADARLVTVRQTHPHAYEPWSAADDAELRHLVAAATPLPEIAVLLGRQPGAVRSRLLKLGLE